MRFDIITLFPEIIKNYINFSILKNAKENQLIQVNTINLRNFGLGKYKQVDDKPYGGDAGMVIMFEPVLKAIKKIEKEYTLKKITKYKIIATTAKGRKYKQSIAKKIKNNNQALIILCGRYEGFDQRILNELVDIEISIGNFVITGGELASLIIIDSISRMISGVLGNKQSFIHDSFYSDDQKIQYPQYTRPEIIKYNNKKLKVPKILLSGNHKKIQQWKQKQTN